MTAKKADCAALAFQHESHGARQGERTTKNPALCISDAIELIGTQLGPGESTPGCQKEPRPHVDQYNCVHWLKRKMTGMVICSENGSVPGDIETCDSVSRVSQEETQMQGGSSGQRV